MGHKQKQKQKKSKDANDDGSSSKASSKGTSDRLSVEQVLSCFAAVVLVAIVAAIASFASRPQKVTVADLSWDETLMVMTTGKDAMARLATLQGEDEDEIRIYIIGTNKGALNATHDLDRIPTLLGALDPRKIFVDLCNQRTHHMLTVPSEYQDMKRTPDGKTVPPCTDCREGEDETLCMARVSARYFPKFVPNSLLADTGTVELNQVFRYWNEVREERSIDLITGDRPLNITILRAFEALSEQDRKSIMMESTFHDSYANDVMDAWQNPTYETMFTVLCRMFYIRSQNVPTVQNVMVKERSRFMAHKLYQHSRKYLQHGIGNRTITFVAIVDDVHVDEMHEILLNNKDDLQETRAKLQELLSTKTPMTEFDAFQLDELVPQVSVDALAAYHQETLELNGRAGCD